MAARVEVRSDHPIARAIVAEATAASPFVVPAAGMSATAGLGAEGIVQNERVLVGNAPLLEQYGILAVMVPTMVDMGGNLGTGSPIGDSPPVTTKLCRSGRRHRWGPARRPPGA